ncbi:protein FAM98B-like [Meleagris gallopavo]|uniref:protein FAM98B-like n=1 Tax=Meleagris gallopavo TaxID=9103 RepID=UPI0012AB796D|nr:protein FAM98B-like [Meleagris gallopavo]
MNCAFVLLVSYKGPLLDDGALAQAVSRGANSPEFTKLCAWLVSELRLFCKLEENVQATNSPNEAEEFQLEVSGLLAEMNCPYTSLTTGDVTKRLLNQKNCLLLLKKDFCCVCECQGIYIEKKKKKKKAKTQRSLCQLKGRTVFLPKAPAKHKQHHWNSVQYWHMQKEIPVLEYGGNVNGPVTKLLMLNASDLEKFASEMFDLQLLISPSENKRAKPHFGLTLK